jgi:hypothetical protein
MVGKRRDKAEWLSNREPKLRHMVSSKRNLPYQYRQFRQGMCDTSKVSSEWATMVGSGNRRMKISVLT